jgi:succinyl-diaminopimelate desuccinylase
MAVIELFKDLLNAESLTPSDGNLYELFTEMLDGFEVLRADRNGVKNIFFYKKFSEGPHLCFAGHVDVVPAGSGWDTNPYEAVEKDGYIYGRGAQDMKSGVAAFVQAVCDAKDFQGTLSLLLTSDEEGPAVDGTVAMLELLRKKAMLPDFAVVAEPTCELEMGDAIKIGRRGSINATLTILGKQGHAAYPAKVTNPVNLLAPKLPLIAGHLLDNGDDYFEPSQLVVTDIRGGMEVTNVTADEVKIMFNVRNNTISSLESIQAYIAKVFHDVPYTLDINQSSRSFMTDNDSAVVHTITDSIERVCGVRPKHSTAGGTSDARYIAEFGIDVVEFGVKNDTIHKVNERTTKKEVELLYESFADLISNFKG